MLTLTRKQGEAIVIEVGGERVEVTVSAFRGRCVRITVDAPRHISIMRKELICPELNDKDTPCRIISLPNKLES